MQKKELFIVFLFFSRLLCAFTCFFCAFHNLNIAVLLLLAIPTALVQWNLQIDSVMPMWLRHYRYVWFVESFFLAFLVQLLFVYTMPIVIDSLMRHWALGVRHSFFSSFFIFSIRRFERKKLYLLPVATKHFNVDSSIYKKSVRFIWNWIRCECEFYWTQSIEIDAHRKSKRNNKKHWFFPSSNCVLDWCNVNVVYCTFGVQSEWTFKQILVYFGIFDAFESFRWPHCHHTFSIGISYQFRAIKFRGLYP